LARTRSGGYRVITPSRFGYLGSPLPAKPTTVAQAEAFVSLLDALGIVRAPVLAFSAGSTSAVQLAVHHPERVSALVLVASNSPHEKPVALAPRVLAPLIFSQPALWFLRVFLPAKLATVAAARRPGRARRLLVDDLREDPLELPLVLGLQVPSVGARQGLQRAPGRPARTQRRLPHPGCGPRRVAPAGEQRERAMSIRMILKRAGSQVEAADEAIRARDQARREQRERIAHRAGWAEVNRTDLTFGWFTIVHQPTGTTYKVSRGEPEADGPSPITAYFYAADGGVVFLEPIA
jgi:pimeloyl-ACP methyl ester carboxylesterase